MIHWAVLRAGRTPRSWHVVGVGSTCAHGADDRIRKCFANRETAESFAAFLNMPRIPWQLFGRHNAQSFKIPTPEECWDDIFARWWANKKGGDLKYGESRSHQARVRRAGMLTPQDRSRVRG
jgi:hypothetical protein